MVSRLISNQSWQLENQHEQNTKMDFEALELKSEFEILDVKEVQNIQARRIKEVADELGISATLARAILIKNAWERQDAIDAVISDPEYIMKEFRVDLSMDVDLHETPFTCPVCFFDCETDEILTMNDCRHQFCIDCFQGYC